MGLDQMFFRTKRKRQYKNGGIIDAVDLSFDKELKDNSEVILCLRKEYDVSEIIYDIYGNTYGDALIIDHKTFRKILKKYEKLIYEEEDLNQKSWMIMVEKQLELINKLFNFNKYCLLYYEIG